MLFSKNKEEDIYGSVDEYLEPADKENEIYAQLGKWGLRNIPSSLIQYVHAMCAMQETIIMCDHARTACNTIGLMVT